MTSCGAAVVPSKVMKTTTISVVVNAETIVLFRLICISQLHLLVVIQLMVIVFSFKACGK